MKQVLVIFSFALLASCGQQTTTTDADKDSTMAMSHDDSIVKYPYSIEHPDEWRTGSRQNTVVALNALKAYENGNIEESVNYFGDSIRLRFDYLDTMVTNEGLMAMFKDDRPKMKSMEIKMEDWESVISKDNESEYVSLWYTQHWEMADGKKDSVMVMDDIQLKNGKIIGLDEKTRKLGPGKM